MKAIAKKTPPLKVLANPNHFSLFLQVFHFIGTNPAKIVITKHTTMNETLSMISNEELSSIIFIVFNEN
jgi:hypothetical protein